MNRMDISADELDRRKDSDELWHSSANFNRTILRAAVMKLVDRVDRYFSFTGFEFVTASGDDFGNFDFAGNWPDEWVRSVEPHIALLEKRIERRLQLLQEKQVADDRLKAAVNRLSDDILALTLDNRVQGFYLGILVGAKMEGASRGQLQQLGRRWVDVVFSQLRFKRKERALN